MDIEVANVASAVVPYLRAVAVAYGVAVVGKVRDGFADGGADATVNLGRRLLQRLLHHSNSADGLGRAMTDLAENPDDEDFQAALRGQVKKDLSADPELRNELIAMLRDAGVSITASGDRAVAAQTISGIVSIETAIRIDYRQVFLILRAVRRANEVDAPSGLSNLPRRPSTVFVGRDSVLTDLEQGLAKARA